MTSLRYTNYLSAGVRMGRTRTRDTNPSLRSSSMDLSVSLPRSPLPGHRWRERSSDMHSSREALRSTDFSINGIQRLKNRSRLLSREDGDNCDDYKRNMGRDEFGLNKSKDHQISSRVESDLSNITINAINVKVPVKKNKKYAWREEMKNMEDEWQNFKEKTSFKTKEIDSDVCNDDLVSNKKPKYIEDYNKAVENILETVKIHDKLRGNSVSSIPKKSSLKKEDFEIEEEIRKLKEKNMLRKSNLLSGKQDDVEARKYSLEVKPSFTERYLQKQIDRKTDQNISQQQEVKKGAWRKDFARYEEDLEIRKLRKETEKKINSLDSDTTDLTSETNPRVKKITVRIIDKQQQNSDLKPNPTKVSESLKHKEYSSDSSDSPTTFVTVKLNNSGQSNNMNEGKVDASLTIKKNMDDKKTDATVKSQFKSKPQVNDPDSNKIIKLEKDKEKKSDPRDNVIQTTNSEKKSKKNVNTNSSKNENVATKMEGKDLKSDGHTETTGEQGTKDEASKSEGTEEEEDEDGMKAMRKETNNTLANMEAEFEAGRSKLAAVRARIRRAREMAKVVDSE